MQNQAHIIGGSPVTFAKAAEKRSHRRLIHSHKPTKGVTAPFPGGGNQQRRRLYFGNVTRDCHTNTLSSTRSGFPNQQVSKAYKDREK